VGWTMFLSRSHIVEIFGIRGRYDDKALARVCWWNVVKLLMFDSSPIFGAATNPHRPGRKSGLEGETRFRTRDLCPHVSHHILLRPGETRNTDHFSSMKIPSVRRHAILFASKGIALGAKTARAASRSGR
jgi:hypothetical protein